MRGIVAWGVVALAGALAGCGATVQTSSGRDYLAARPDFKPPAGATVERAVYDAANTEPALRFPARIGLARIRYRELTAIPPDEADKWLELIRSAGSQYGEFVPISPLVVDMAATGRDFGVIDRIRVGAARQHVDAVLVYEVSDSSRDRGTPLTLLDATIIGAFLVPSRAIEGQAVANATLIDVRNGYPYGTATSTAERTGFVVNNGSRAKSEDLAAQASVEAVSKLAVDVGTMMARLKSELDSKELAKLRVAQPVPPHKLRRAAVRS